jgi:hypothetical protein
MSSRVEKIDISHRNVDRMTKAEDTLCAAMQ